MSQSGELRAVFGLFVWKSIGKNMRKVEFFSSKKAFNFPPGVCFWAQNVCDQKLVTELDAYLLVLGIFQDIFEKLLGGRVISFIQNTLMFQT